MTNFIKKNKWFLLLSFVVPLLLMGIILAANQIYWGSTRSILAGDSYHQYVALHALYDNILHSAGKQGFFYTFTSGLGMNLYAFAAYYMGSFFMPITFFFNVHNMPDALYLLTLLKAGFMGLSFFISFKNMYKKLPNLILLAFACAYSLMSFITSQVEIVMWLDIFILLPLIIWGLHRLQDDGKRMLYFVSLTILFIQNYYFGFMVALFLVLYFLARATRNKWSFKTVLDFLVSSVCAGIASLIMLLPMYLDLKANNTGAFSEITQLFTENSKPFDLFAKNFVGAYDTTQYNAVPMIYVGLFPLLLAVLFFFLKSISWKTKMAHFGVLAVLIASFYFQILDLFWQGMHSPNMFLHRYAFLFSLFILILACETFVRLKEIKIRSILIAVGFLVLGFAAAYFYQTYAYLALENLLLTALFLLAYLILLISRTKKWISIKLFLPILALFMVAEAGINGYFQIEGLQKEWNFASRTYYNQQTDTIDPLVEKANQIRGTQLSRMDNTTPDTANDGMKFGYNSISQFSSVRNSNSSSVMRELGFHTDDTYLNLRYPLNTILMDSIFAIRFNISQSQPSKYGFNPVSADGNLSALTENANALSTGIFVPGGYQDATFIDDQTSAIKNQTAFVNALTKSNQKYFNQIYTTSEKTDNKITGSGDSITLTKKPVQAKEDLSVTYGLTVPAHTQLYLSIPNLTYLDTSANTTVITVSQITAEGHLQPGAGYTVGTNDTGYLFNLGDYDKETQIKVTVSFPGNSQVSFDTTSFWALNTSTYQKTIDQLKSNRVDATELKNGASFEVNAKTSGDLFMTLPYDKGWSATVDGKAVTIERAQDGFMKVAVPKGKHTIKMTFVPQGFKTGLVAFVLGCLLFVTYDYLRRKKE
ncbi:YfhO family protein [Lactococcus sp.]|uniref:YfhO family protein n=1 Tax=Lactococcus sp. TaxID=44273 RepID=UPI0035AE8F7D